MVLSPIHAGEELRQRGVNRRHSYLIRRCEEDPPHEHGIETENETSLNACAHFQFQFVLNMVMLVEQGPSGN